MECAHALRSYPRRARQKEATCGQFTPFSLRLVGSSRIAAAVPPVLEMVKLPLLDIRAFRRDPYAFAETLRHACHHIGFFQLRHGVPTELVRETKAVAREFFALPEESKRQIDYSRSAQFRGYMSNGVENTAGKPDLREQVEIAPEEPASPAKAMPPHRRLRGPNQWPAELPTMRPAVEEYAAAMGGVGEELTEALCLALGWERTALRNLFKPEAHWQLKLAQYSPASVGADGATSEGGEREPEIGVGAHTDSGWLTLLLQDNSGGLQAFARGAWRDVPPLGDDVVVCNLGEVAELLSGGYLLATPHRVLLPKAQRLSVPYFYNPQLDAEVRSLPLPPHLPWEREDDYDEKSHWRREGNAMIASYGLNAFKSLARSHPAVFARHHPDLQVTSDGQVEPRVA